MDSKTSDSARLAPVIPDVVWFSGEDALRFLNDLISREIGDMADGDSRRTLLLEPQGKLQFAMWAVKDGERFGLVTDPGRGDELASALSRYRIRVDVEIRPEEKEVWVVVGDYAGPDLSWAGVERHLVFGDRPDLPVMSESEYESLRIAAGEPMWGRDVDGDTIPHVSGLVPVSVDFDKGCYLGQELVARIDSRGGNVPRHLRLLDAGPMPLESGASVVAGGTEVGKVTSASGGLALATIHRDIPVGDKVSAGGVEALVKELPAKPR